MSPPIVIGNRAPAPNLLVTCWTKPELQQVAVEVTPTGDHYNLQAKAVRLTQDKYDGCSLTAITVAAHEVGHAIQDAHNEALFRNRHNPILPWRRIPDINPLFESAHHTMVNVALFPIPNAVNFPGVPCPLHVFEPRYRQMVKHCIEQRMLLEELDDGRMLIQVNNEVRLTLVEEKQTLPFSIWSCEELLDEPRDNAADKRLEQSQEKILQRLLVITHDNKEAQELLHSEYWQTMPAHRFSYAVAGFLGMPADTSQALLEITNAQARLDTVLHMLNAIGPGIG